MRASYEDIGVVVNYITNSDTTSLRDDAGAGEAGKAVVATVRSGPSSTLTR
jgi:hypothetical protein